VNFLDEKEWIIYNAANKDLENAWSDGGTTRLRLDPITYPQSLHCNTMPCNDHADISEENDSKLSGDSDSTAVHEGIVATDEVVGLFVHVDADYALENGRSQTGNYIMRRMIANRVATVTRRIQTDAS
jgi:hypothetical protein